MGAFTRTMTWKLGVVGWRRSSARVAACGPSGPAVTCSFFIVITDPAMAAPIAAALPPATRPQPTPAFCSTSRPPTDATTAPTMTPTMRVVILLEERNEPGSRLR
jgi:hypothetical protein